MNIFVLDKCAEKSAQYLCNIHLNKMLIEHTQMLANCYSYENLNLAPKTQSGTARKYSYYNHPVSIWVRQSNENFQWLWYYTIKILEERQFRGYKEHFCKEFLLWCSYNKPDNIKNSYNILTPFVLVMPEKYKKELTVDSYRDYYINEKQYTKSGKWMLKYTKRELPYWFPNWLVEKCKENNENYINQNI